MHSHMDYKPKTQNIILMNAQKEKPVSYVHMFTTFITVVSDECIARPSLSHKVLSLPEAELRDSARL